MEGIGSFGEICARSIEPSMTVSDKVWFAKCLLFGEHIVLRGAEALAVPLRNFSGSWETSEEGETDAYVSKLLEFADYLDRIPDLHLDTDAFRSELKEGLYFQSNIPHGYGAGSSGALVAGLYARYVQRPELAYGELRRLFGEMESFFHGASSGTDPLICYLERAVHLHPTEGVRTVPLAIPEGFEIYLIDTEQSRSSGKWVNRFLEKYQTEERFRERCENELIPASNAAIDCWKRGDWHELWRNVETISNNQLYRFTEFIPERFHELWFDGLDEAGHRLKLCGAGGGGFILAFVRDREAFLARTEGRVVLRALF